MSTGWTIFAYTFGACVVAAFVGVIIIAAACVLNDWVRDHVHQDAFKPEVERQVREAIALTETPIFDALAAETLHAELDDDAAVAEWLR